MPRFFVSPDNISENHATITGSDVGHISRSLRMNVGDALTICDTEGYDYSGVIRDISPETILVEISDKTASITEPKAKITLYQALPKGSKLEFIIEKAVELGVHQIVPVLTERCVSRPNEKSMSKKIQRYEKIVEAAAKQSGRGIIPKIKPLLTFEQALERAGHDLTLVFYENATTPLKNLLAESPLDIGIFIGSEGGFSPEEIQLAQSKGAETASLGKRILRCETAPLVACSVIMFSLGELE